MEKYRDVIQRVLTNRPIINDENLNPNTERHTDEIMKIRKVNFKLQDDKAQLIEELKVLRDSYIKHKKLNQTRDAENKKLKSQLSKMKQKLARTETLNGKLEKRLYSTKKSSGAGTPIMTVNHSTKSTSNFSTEVAAPKTVQYSVQIQTDQKQKYQIACQTDFNSEVKKQQPRFAKDKYNNMKSLIDLTESVKISTYETDRTSLKTSTDGILTQRHTGRIVSGRRKAI